MACLFGGAPSACAQTVTTYGSGGSSNTFTGGTIIPGDTVLLNDGATVTGDITANGTLQFNQSAGNALTISNLISGTGTLWLTNTGTLNLTGTSGATNTVVLDMTTSTSLGVLQIVSGTGDLIVGNSGTGTLNVTGGYVSSKWGTLGNAAGSVGTATVSSGTWANSGNLTVGVSGTGTLNVNGGYVSNLNGILGNFANTVGTATVSSGTWANSGNLTVGSSGTGTLTMNGGLVTVGGTLSRGNSGTINLNSGGTLQIGVGSTGGVLLGGTGDLLNNGTLVFNRSDASTYSGVISGTGAVTKQGAGTLTFTGTSSYTGATAVNGGSLLVNGRLGNTAVSVGNGALLGGSGTIDGVLTVLAGGTLSPGNSPGTLHVGSLQLDGSSTTLMEITGTATGLYDQIVATNNIAYGGLLQLTMSGSYSNDTVFQLFQFGSESGDFSSLTMAGGSSPYAGLTVGAIGTGGYGVDAWVSDWTTPSAPNGQRLVFYQNTGVLAVVPEPSTYAMALAGLACGGWQMYRRRRLRQAPTLAA